MKYLVPKALTIGCAAMAAVGLVSIPASSATTVGTVTLVTNNNASSTSLASGNSDTLFGVNLSPSAQAANGTINQRPDCSGDSATGSTFAYTYLIHAGENVTSESFAQGEPGTLPDGSTTLALFDRNGTIETNPSGPYGDTFDLAIGTAQINLPPQQQFQWGQITAATGGGAPVTGPNGLLYQTDPTTGTPIGTWQGGYACFKNGVGLIPKVTDFWSFLITFRQDAVNGGSQGFTWSVVQH